MHYRLLSVSLSLFVILTWIEKFEFAIVNPTNSITKVQYNISINDSIECPHDGASYQWSRIQNGTEIQLSTERNLTELLLLQHGEGVYKCSATNANTNQTELYDIDILYSTHDPLIDFQANGDSWQTIQLDWQTHIETEPISSYSLELCPRYLASDEACTEEVRTVELSEITSVLDSDRLQFNHSLTITGLLPYHQYTLSLIYSNSDATRNIETTASTQAGPPVVAHLDIYVKWVQSGELFIGWTSLESKHTSNVTYTYKLFIQRDNILISTKIVSSDIETRVSLSLKGDVNYVVKLCAENTHGNNCIDEVESGTYQAPEEDILTKLPLILIILLAVLIYFALVIICCLLVVLFTKRSRKRRAFKNAVGEFQLTPPKRKPKIAHRLAVFETERDSGISDNRSHSHTSDEAREHVTTELTESRVRNSKIPLRHLRPCLDQHLENGCQLAIEEFADLRKGLLQEATVGLLPENKKKNRHPNICPYDFNRVQLLESYYINASSIVRDPLNASSIRDSFSYITTQGPLPSTINSFWQMVWEKGITVIVMLSPEPSPSTCEVYWSHVGETAVVDNLHVTHDSSQTFGHYIQRNFTLNSPGSDSEKRLVTQLHFTIWPQSSLPIHPHFLWQFITKVHRLHSANSKSDQPLLLHCPDGSENCGLFLVLFEMLLDLIKNEPDELNVFELIQRLREQRTSFIPTADQYCFIYKALLDQVNRTDTSINKHNFSIACKYMDQPIETSSNIYKEQFDSLEVECPDPQLSDARHPINLHKNRYEDQLPNNLFRVLLDIRLTGETSDYINASYIDSFTQRRAFIATQGPLEHTVPQFWSMVFSTHASVIVMLTNLYEDGQEMCAHYWPTGAEMLTIKNLHISVIDEIELGPFKQREFLIESGNQRQQVYQLSIPNWSVAGSLPQCNDILQLAKQTSRLQRANGTDKPTIIHCDDGVGRTGTFLSIFMVLEQMVYEGVVDVFQTVKGLRIQRPHMVDSLRQYIYCHQTVLEAITKEFTFQ